MKKVCGLVLAVLVLAGCNGNTVLSETTTNAETTQAVEQSAEETTTQAAEELAEAASLVPTRYCPDETVDLNELTNVEASYYETEDYCYLAVSGSENAVRCYKGEEFDELTLSACKTRFFYYEDKLDIDMLFAEFDGEITANGYISKVDGEALFEPDAEEWNAPVILGKNDGSAARIVLRDYSVENGERVRAEVTLKNLLLKWNNGSASGMYDYADVVEVKTK